MTVAVAVILLLSVHRGCVVARSSLHHPARNTVLSCRCEFRTPSNVLSCLQASGNEDLGNCLRDLSAWAIVAEDLSEEPVTASSTRVQTIVVSGGRHLKTFNLNVFADFVSVRNLSLAGNNIHRFDAMNVSLPSVVHLDLSRNDLRTINPQLTIVFPNLRSLNVSHNNLTQLSPDVFAKNPHLKSVSLKSNKWKCASMDWLRDSVHRGKLLLTDWKQTQCWYMNSTDKPMLLTESCPTNCSCIPARYKLIVNCSGRGYQSLPLHIPPDTNQLHLQNNNISSFSSLLDMYNKVKEREKAKGKDQGPRKSSKNHEEERDKAAVVAYKQLVFLYLDNNSLTSLNELENLTSLFVRLVSLTVTGNQLRQIPVHVFQEMFLNMLLFVKLSDNPWDCHCNFTVKLIRMMMNSNKVEDAALLRCADSDSRNPGKAVVKLREVDLCYLDPAGVHPLDVLNGCLALAILLCVLKLAYDWKRMKETGKLPAGPYTLCAWLRCRRKSNNNF